jgi:uncharacterized protein YbcV (DUF1398 family)
MDAQTKAIIQQCTKRSDENSIAFPDVVQQLMTAGVESYRADLVRADKTYYLPNGETLVTPSDRVAGMAPSEFSADAVAAAVKSIQQGKIDYAEFCRRIVEAGCVNYVVSLVGRRAIYSGRSGDCYVERFPNAA